MNNNFNPGEIVRLERYNKKLKKNVVTEFPVVGGRLRLFHEDLQTFAMKSADGSTPGSIQCEVIQYKDDVAVVQATVTISGAKFTGIGMSSKARDTLIYPAILEMAETRAIARALRFAGYGVEYTGAEEMQGVKNFGVDESSTNEQNQHVNDDSTPSKSVSGDSAPSLKRQVWEYVVSLYPGVQENYLAAAIKSFVLDTVAKYENGNAESVYGMILINTDRFEPAFAKYVEKETPAIQSPGIVDATTPGEEPVIENVDTQLPVAEPTPWVNPELKEAYESLKEVGIDKLNVDPPQPVVDSSKVAKANIYREMPDGISVAALNGTLKDLIDKNPTYTPDDIYSMVLADIPGFMIMIENWCKNNSFESGLEKEKAVAAKEKAPAKPETPNKPATGITKAAFRKSWVRLDLENFSKFIIVNSDTFKEDREEYDMAVAKFDRLKAKSPETKDMVFPYLFSHEDARLDTSNSVIPEPGKEVKIMRQYTDRFPKMSKTVLNNTGISVGTDSEDDATRFNSGIEDMIMQFEAENQKEYTEE